MIINDLNSSPILNQINLYEESFYPCLKKNNRLTLQEKAILMKYPEERVKKAIEYSLVQSPRTTLMEQLTWHCSQPTPTVYRSMWQENKLEIIATIALSIVAIALPVFFLRYLESPHHSLLLDKADPNRLMATDIKSFNDLSNLKQLNGVNISIIENRARPGEWANTGFIGKEDNLLDVLQKDWKTVGALGTTHIEIADHLQAIWNISSKLEENKENPKNLITYDFNSIKGNTINTGSSIKTFYTDYSVTQGWQNDIFDSCITDNLSEDFDKCYESFNDRTVFGCDLHLTNPENKEHIHVTDAIIQYIKKYGFYESGEENFYSIDPIRLASVFTGHRYCSIAKAIKQPCNSKAPNDPYYRLN